MHVFAIVEIVAREASLSSETSLSYTGVGENVSFPDFPCGTRLSGSAFSSCHLSCQKLSSSHFSLYPSISLPPRVSPRPFFLSSIYVSHTHLAISIKMCEKSRDCQTKALFTAGLTRRFKRKLQKCYTIPIMRVKIVSCPRGLQIANNGERSRM